jgi:predicted TIM-barrel fold metal-dependent hydrolase
MTIFEKRKRADLGISTTVVLLMVAIIANAQNPPPPALTNTISIVNVHEHIQSIAEAPKLIEAMDRVNVSKTALVGSSWFTITLDQRVGFSRYDENNEELLKIVQRYPGRFEAWPTMNPLDPDKLDKFRSLVVRGATGLKLYLGHGMLKTGTQEYFFHVMPLDDPRMLPVYAFCQENFLPICMHVNPGPTKPGFAREFVNVLTQFPDLKIICPHFMLSSIHRARLEEFLQTFPNLYTDISFGHDDYLIDGIERISDHAASIRLLIERYPDRFMFGTDCVVTSARFKTSDWISQRYQTYVDMLTKAGYETPVLPGKKLIGLALPPELVSRVLSKNFEAFVAKRPQGTKIIRTIQWERMYSGEVAASAIPKG